MTDESIDQYPTARADLEVHEADDGLIIYDRLSDRAHHLNTTASVIFSLCTGEVDEETMAEQLKGAFELDRAPEAEVAECLTVLRTEGLLV